VEHRNVPEQKCPIIINFLPLIKCLCENKRTSLSSTKVERADWKPWSIPLWLWEHCRGTVDYYVYCLVSLFWSNIPCYFISYNVTLYKTLLLWPLRFHRKHGRICDG